MLINLQINDDIAFVQLNNPKKLNALSSDLMSELSDKLLSIESQAKVIILYGSKKAFAAGVDIADIAKYDYENAHLNNFIDQKWEALFNVRIPVISAVSGYALGGGFELVLASDIVIASETSKFGFPEVNLGLMPGLGGTQMLTKLIGAKIASRIMMSGEFISAQEAFNFGIISKIVSQEELLLEAKRLAERIAQKSRMSLILIKEAIRLAQNTGLNQGMKTERIMFRSLFSTTEKQRHISDFLNGKK